MLLSDRVLARIQKFSAIPAKLRQFWQFVSFAGIVEDIEEHYSGIYGRYTFCRNCRSIAGIVGNFVILDMYEVTNGMTLIKKPTETNVYTYNHVPCSPEISSY